MSTHVIIKPAGVRDENIGVFIFAMLVLCIATWYITISASSTPKPATIQPGQLDSRHDLNPIEQGLYADLKAASEEILWRIAEHEAISVEALSDDYIPPFVTDVVSQERGEHEWLLLTQQKENSTHDWLYVGSTTKPETAGSFALLIQQPPAKEHTQANAQKASLWYLDSPVPPNDGTQDNTHLDSLLNSGWKQVISHFDASVTRPGT